MGKEHIMMASVPDSLYKALKSGSAMQNNGLRSTKGFFWSEQPTLFEAPNNSFGGTKNIAKAASSIGGFSGKSMIGVGIAAFAAGALVKHAISNNQTD